MAKKRRDEVVPRPIKSTEYALHFITADAEKGWRDAEATARNHIAEAWDYLTKTPDLEDPEKCYVLKGRYATLSYQGAIHDRYQYKINKGGRIWYAVVKDNPRSGPGGKVLIEDVRMGHPEETMPGRNFR